jgi:hypothetical protein
MLARDGASGFRAFGRCHSHIVAAGLQDFRDPFDERVCARPELTGAGIEDEDSIPVGCYVILPFSR